jgi:rRNA maturation protein Nop10
MGSHSNYGAGLYKDYEELFQKNEKQAGELRTAKYNYNLAIKQIQTLENQKQEMAAQNAAKDAAIADLTREVDRLRAILNIDGSNSGLPTSMTPISKNKVIPNSRKKTGKKIGGQPGHAKHKLERFRDEDVNAWTEHPLETCPHCGCAGLEDAGATIEKDELDYKVIVEKTRHMFKVYRCPGCGKDVHEHIPPELKEENQYGPQVQALSLTLMNQGNMPINKVAGIVRGFTDGEISPSEGYLCKLQQRAAKGVQGFCDELRGEILKQAVVYRDDTVIPINTRRACLRYYGTENLALYKAHEHKDKAGLDEDNILSLLPKDTTVVHDHNKVNYNKEYSFSNAECNEHLLRDLAKVQQNLGHKWAEELAKLLTDGNGRREELKDAGVAAFPPDELSRFFGEFDRIMFDAYKQNDEAGTGYYADAEGTLILRIMDYKNEYLAWAVDFSLPFTNNLSERSLRGVKSKMKAAGQFQNVMAASYYANIKSYMETCFRNGENVFFSMLRLCLGKPFTLEEILPQPPPT